MKKIKSRLAIILTVMMIISLFEVVGVFAGSEDGAKDSSTVTAQQTASLELETHNSFESVRFMWNDVGAAYYKVSENGGAEKVVSNLPTEYGKYQYNVKAAPGSGAKLTVKAYNDQNGLIEEATASNSAVQNGLYRVRIKKGGTLKSHGGPRKTIRISKGQYIYAYGFGGGKYIFKDGDSIFYCNKSRTNKRSVIFQRGWNYSRRDAECFVNDRGVGSGTNHLVWVNVYCQHMYFFDKVNGRWKCTDDWECSTGKASTPAPTGVSGMKTIHKKIKKRHGIPYWSCYSDINSIHGKKKKWSMGAPKSNGCIRNPNEKAYIVYVYGGKGTRVYIY